MVTDPHEYQDSYGFVQAALRLVKSLPKETENEYGTHFEEIRGYLDNISDLWVDITAQDKTAGDPSRLAGAAARIELAMLSIKD
jgi:hypothetical protein